MAESRVGKPANFRKDAPAIATQGVPACPVCASTRRQWRARGFDFELETCANPWDFWTCQDCAAVWLDPRPATSTMPVIYPPHYYSYGMSKTISPFVLWGKAQLDRFKFRGILSALGREPVSYMDVGCGDGRYLRMMADRGLDRGRIHGTELTRPVVEQLSGEGFRMFESRVEECTAITPGSLDLITMFHVIEHVEDPVRVLTRLGEWLTPDGLLVLETPNVDSFDARLYRDTWWGGYHIPRHWTLFEPASIVRALDAAGLVLVGLRYQTGHSFWLYSFHHAAKFNRRLPMPRLARHFDPLRSRVALMVVTAFDLVRRQFGSKTSAMLILAKRKTA